MQAIVQERYGSPAVLELRTTDVPIPGDDEVLVRVHAASINPLDWHLITGLPYLVRTQEGMRRPRRTIPGADVAGTVEAVGAAVTRFRPGDAVFGEAKGTFAEYTTVAERLLVHKPDEIGFEQAAAIPVAGLTALQGLRDHGELAPDQQVLINGASGGVGTLAVQIAQQMGAHVTGVCSTRNVELVRSLGADRVIDYATEDFTKTDERYDVILDNVGNRPLAACRRILTAGGRYVMVSGPKRRWLGPARRMLAGYALFAAGDRKFRWFVAQAKREDLEYLADLVVRGNLAPVIDRRVSLDGVVEAIDELARGHVSGKLIVTMAAPAPGPTTKSAANPQEA